MKQPDILLFMSDQHGADYCSWGDVKVDTPTLDAIRKTGTVFENTYTSCPLCVPARISFMSSKLPSDTGCYGNQDALPDITPCFTHALVAAGYETVLAGRMHFVGEDQRHGFTKRIAPDITPVSWTVPKEKMAQERGNLMECQGEPFCLNYVGAGESPVMNYDKMVIEQVLEYLEEPHEKPQFILVGTYGPHFPYITSKEMYLKYYDRVEKPSFYEPEEIPEYLQDFELQSSRMRGEEARWEVTRGARAAYCGLVEIMDSQIGKVKKAFEKHTERHGTEGIFGYCSDHGDTLGERRMFGKQTYYEKSAKIPFLLTGSGVPANKQIQALTSIMDIGPTICELAGTEYTFGEGRSLLPYFAGEEDGERIVVSQFVEKYKGESYASMMLRYKNYKYISYHHYENKDMLFNLKEDPKEGHNCITEKPEIVEYLKNERRKLISFDEMEKQRADHGKRAQLFIAVEKNTGINDEERWKDNPPEARGELEIAAASEPIVPGSRIMRI